MSKGYVAASTAQESAEVSPPIFEVTKLDLQFSILADFVAAQAANNVLIFALSSGRILRVDWDRPQDIDDIDLPKRPTEIGVIRRMFLDPTASHLIITTTLGENYYLHTQSRQPKALSRLKGVSIECIAWNPSLPTASTREILVGAADGHVYETFIEPSSEFYRREEKYRQSLYKAHDSPITGLWLDAIPTKPELRRILVVTQGTILHYIGPVGRHGHEGSGPVYLKIFENEEPTAYDISRASLSAPSMLAISPDSLDVASFEHKEPDRVFAWLSAQGVYYGKLSTAPATPDLGTKVFNGSKSFARGNIMSDAIKSRRKSAPSSNIDSIALTQWHILILFEGRVIAVNRLDGKVVYDQMALEPGQNALGLVTDSKKNTYWLFTSTEILEIIVNDEDRDIWKIMLKDQKFDAALTYAKDTADKDAVATASGDYLMGKQQYLEAAGVYGKSSKAFESVCLKFIDVGAQDALRKYLLTKLGTYKRSFVMQRVMIATWLVEIFMAKLNSLDDNITTKAELAEENNPNELKDQLGTVRSEYRNFVTKYKSDLDQKSAYDIMSSHGREQELLFFASAVNDYHYVLTYWIQRERWDEALSVLKQQTNPEVFYKYSSVIMAHLPLKFVDILTRQSNIEPENLIPAMLNYNKSSKHSLNQNQAVRYLLFCINQLSSTSPAIHNTLVSIYASSNSTSESALLSYLSTQVQQDAPYYDSDFALRLCILHSRIESCVHIYTTTKQYLPAVELALAHDNVELASRVAEQVPGQPTLQKKLWLAIARSVISKSPNLAEALPFLTQTPLLKIEDLLSLLPDFLTIDTLRDSICSALETYSAHIDELKREMDESAATANDLTTSISKLDERFVIVEPGEKCALCAWPLLSRQFWVFACMHGFHADCLAKEVLRGESQAKQKKMKQMQLELQKGLAAGARREVLIKELDGLIAASCVLCSDFAVKRIDEPFVAEGDEEADSWKV
ncbi:MAG: hypothetical protein M1814_003895 [Vezdaea aestivalis]|nr:MAG: hypothetical protein M1814_003895 [Vezdaea aestivalis]